MNAQQLSVTLGKASGKLNKWFSNIGQKTTGLLAHTTDLARHQVKVMSGKAGLGQTGAGKGASVNTERSRHEGIEYDEADYDHNLTDDDITDGDFDDDSDYDRDDVNVDDLCNATIVDSAHVLTAHDLFLLRTGGETLGEDLVVPEVSGLETVGSAIGSNSPRVLTGAYGRQLATQRRYKDTTDTESIVSDYSEIAEPLREHLANMHAADYDEDYFRGGGGSDAGSGCDEQLPGGGGGMIVRLPGECAEDYERRAKKANFLSLAAEFAALKRVDPAAKPFGAMQREGSDGQSCSDLSVTSERSSGDRDSMSLHSTTAPGAGSSGDECRDLEHSLSVDSGVVEPPAHFRDSSSTIETPASVFNTSSQQSQFDFPSGRTANGQCQQLAVGDVNGGLRAEADTKLSPGKSNGSLNCSGKLPASSKTRNAMDDDPFDVYSIETALPQLDWDRLEKAIVQSSPAKKPANTQPVVPKSAAGDREEIRRKLAMGSVDTDCDDDDDYGVGRLPRRVQVAPSRQQQAAGLHMCFMNEAADNKMASPTTGVAVNNGIEHHHVPQSDEDYFFTQEQLQQQARQALAQVKPMAQLQLALEKRSKKKSNIAQMVGLPDITDKKALNSRRLHTMNMAQLQVLLNELHSQIESLSEDLVQQLMARDDLHMEQDSMLVDIEDLHMRAEEYSERSGGKKGGKVSGSK